MSRFLIAGVVQKETIVRVASIPIEYEPVHLEAGTIFSDTGGNAYDMSVALKFLGNEIQFLSMVGKEDNPESINRYGNDIQLDTAYILPRLEAMPASVTFCDKKRRQQVYEDRKNIETTEYDSGIFSSLLPDADMVLLENTNFCKSFLNRAKEAGKKIAVDLHAAKNGNYSKDEEFIQNADILYISDDYLMEEPYAYVRKLSETYPNEIIILGQGAKGLIMFDRNEQSLLHYNTVNTLKIVSTPGAGSALFSCFLHYYAKGETPSKAIKFASLFASYKIGFMGSANGFMTEEQMKQWIDLIWNKYEVY